MCFFMSMLFMLIEIELKIEINNDELLETIWDIRNGVDLHYSVKQCKAQICRMFNSDTNAFAQIL